MPLTYMLRRTCDTVGVCIIIIGLLCPVLLCLVEVDRSEETEQKKETVQDHAADGIRENVPPNTLSQETTRIKGHTEETRAESTVTEISKDDISVANTKFINKPCFPSEEPVQQHTKSIKTTEHVEEDTIHSLVDKSGDQVKKSLEILVDKTNGETDTLSTTGKAETKKEAGVSEPGVQEKDLPSFQEWMVAEKEKSLHENILSNAVDSKVNGVSKSVIKMKNYASAECGAKVLQSNPEALNPFHVLSENKDNYMNTPCKVKKWFVLELCESLQHIKAIELANFELFSSTPETFRVYYSDRHPTKDWKLLGKFRAKDVRTVQSFSLNEVSDQIYSKYVKVEMLSHYGSEHYCPLSILRVYGVGVHEDSDDSPSDEDVDNDITPDKDGPKSLFNNAKDVVVNAVKTITGISDDSTEEDVQQTGQNMSHMERDDICQQVHHGPCSIGNESVLSYLLFKCLPYFNSTARPFDSTPCMSNTCRYGIVMYPEPFTKYCPANHSRDSRQLSTGNTSIEIQTNTKDKEEIHNVNIEEANRSHVKNTDAIIDTYISPSTDITHVEKQSENVEQSKSHTVVSSSDFSIKIPNDAKTSLDTDKRVDKINTKVSPSSEVPISSDAKDRSELKTSSYKLTSDTHVLPSIIDSLSSHSSSVIQSHDEDTAGLIEPKPLAIPPTVGEPTITAVDASDIRPSSLDKEAQSVPSTNIQSSLQLQETSTEHARTDIADVTTRNVTDAVIAKIVDEDTSPNQTYNTPKVIFNGTVKLETSANIDNFTTNDAIVAATKTTYLVSKVTPPVSPSVSSTEKLVTPSTLETSSVSAAMDIKHADISAIPAGTEADKSVVEKEITADIKTEEPEDLDKTSTVQTSSIPRKDTAVMRLNNRVKTLEMNISLSSRYLEQLSQRYKKRMEEMQKAFNETFNKLKETARSAEERDIAQQKNIVVLQTQVSALNETVSHLLEQMKLVYTQVLGAHIILMVLEVVVLCVIMAYCIRKRRHMTSEELAAILRGHSVQDTSLVRSRSLNGFVQRSIDPVVETVGSHQCNVVESEELNISVIEPIFPYMEHDNLQHNGSHRKKKKKKKVTKPTEFGALLSVSLKNEVGRSSPTTLDNNAGLLFQGAGVSWNTQIDSAGGSTYSQSATSVDTCSSSRSSSQVGLVETDKYAHSLEWKKVLNKNKIQNKKELRRPLSART